MTKETAEQIVRDIADLVEALIRSRRGEPVGVVQAQQALTKALIEGIPSQIPLGAIQGQSLAADLAEFQRALTRLELVVGQLPDRPESEIPIGPEPEGIKAFKAMGEGLPGNPFEKEERADGSLQYRVDQAFEKEPPL